MGTLLNTAAVIVGATIGTLLGHRLSHNVRGIAMQGVGLVTLVLGLQMALQVRNILVLLVSVLAGGLVGEMLRIEARLDQFGTWAQSRFERRPVGASTSVGESTFARAFVTSSLVFCVGPVTILGAIQDGLTGDFRLLAIKSVLDGIAASIFASVLGKGVFLSAAVVLIYQGALTLAARLLGGLMVDPASDPGVLELTAVGGTLVLGIGLKLLDVAAVRVGNFLPALVLAPLLSVLVRALPWA